MFKKKTISLTKLEIYPMMGNLIFLTLDIKSIKSKLNKSDNMTN